MKIHNKYIASHVYWICSAQKIHVSFLILSVKWAKDGKDYLTLPGKSSTTEIRELERVTSKLRIGDATQVNKAQIILYFFSK